MRAFVIKEYAHPSQIPLTKDAPEPQVGPDQVLLEVYSAGLNFFDVGSHSLPWLSTSLLTLTLHCRFFNHKGSIRTSRHFHLYVTLRILSTKTIPDI